MNYRRFGELYHEFAHVIEQLHTLYLDSLSGYSVLHERLLDHQATMARILGESELAQEKFQDMCSMLYEHLCSKSFTPVARSPVMKQGDMKERLKDNGANTVLLGRQCLVSAYAYWEEYLRPEVGKALGVIAANANGRTEKSRKILNENVKEDFWGDIRYIRNAIVHNNGTATSEIAKCRVLRWFMAGQPIDLRLEHMTVIFIGMGYYRNWLNQQSFEKRNFTLQVPRDEG
jgi:hypothetical protein